MTVTEILKRANRRLISCLLFHGSSLSLLSQYDSLSSISTDSNSIYAQVPFFRMGSSNEGAESDEQDISPLLQSNRDVFLQFAVFQFAAGRYRMRGYPAENQTVLFNGINVSNLETGYSAWNQWGGLNDVSRKAEIQFSNTASRYNFSGPGGYVHIDSKATSFRKGTKFSLASGNRLFQQRMMVTHSTGLMQNGWALTVSGSWRYGDQVYVPGTYYNSKSFFVSVDKKINTQHLINFTALSVNTEQGRSSAEQQELFDISHNHYYNSNWGLQNGKVRNASVSRMKKPILILSHVFEGKLQNRLNTQLLYTFGQSGITGLNWNDAPNPRPDYYQYLPSNYYSQGDTAGGNLQQEAWSSDVTVSQIHWDQLINMNLQNIYALSGQAATSSETRARYILENKTDNLKNLGFNTVYNQRFGAFYFTAGCNANLYRNRKYKVMEDLLGATYWLDYDQFADNLGIDNSYQQNDIEHPDQKIYTGDRFGYDYSINMNRVECWTQVEYSVHKTEMYFGMSLASETVWREGFVANGKFPDNSKGLSNKVSFFNPGFKGGITYKINGRHFLNLNGLVQSRAPEVNSIFISPRTRNFLVSDLQNEKLNSIECNYLVKYPSLKCRFTGYISTVHDQTWLRSYWHDEYNNNVNLVMTGLNQIYQGLELGVEKTLFTEHVLSSALGYGNFTYSNRPKLQAWQDNNNTMLYSDRLSYLTNYHCGGSPQTVFGLSYRYSSRRHWFAGLAVNYFDHIFTELNPERRTEDAIDKYLSDEKAYYQTVIRQEQLPAYFLMNASAGKSFQFKRKYYLNLNIVLYNLLNNKSLLSLGFEQLRWDKNNLNKFANKYVYLPGTTFMCSASFSFN